LDSGVEMGVNKSRDTLSDRGMGRDNGFIDFGEELESGGCGD
jgi:hypothetical protein